jgi:hypothetical protein
VITDALGTWRELSPIILEPWEWRRAPESVQGRVYRVSVLSGNFRDMFCYVRLRYRDRSYWGTGVIERSDRYYPDAESTLITLNHSIAFDPYPWNPSPLEKWIEFMQRPTSGGLILPGISLRVEELV